MKNSKELVIDFHSHILPKIDDGSDSSNTSIEMLSRSFEYGVDVMIATPHFYGHRQNLDHFLEKRQISAERLHSKTTSNLPKILLGAEVAFYSGIDELENLKSLCIEGTDLLLLEMPFTPWSGYEIDVLSSLALDRDIKIILAHFERFYDMQKDSNILNRVLELPVYIQINAGTINSFWKRKRWLEWLGKGKAHLLGSDCHNLQDRVPNLGQARDIINKKLGTQTLRNIDALGTSIIQDKVSSVN